MKKRTSDTPKFGNGLVQLMKVDGTTRQIRINSRFCPHDRFPKWAASWQNQQTDVCPAKTQIIRSVWSESSLSIWRKVGLLAIHWAHSEDSDQTETAQTFRNQTSFHDLVVSGMLNTDAHLCGLKFKFWICCLWLTLVQSTKYFLNKIQIFFHYV